MAKVKIQGHASGTGILTVTAPNTSTDRTITLPDSTDTLAVNSDVTNKLPLAGGTLTGNTTIATNSVPLLALKRTGNNAGNGYIECHGADDSVDYAIRFAQTNGVMSFDNGGSRIMGVTADGLTFGTDTAAANALDDYEEGTHNSVWTTGNSGSISMNRVAMGYVKVGKVVTITGEFDVTSVSSPIGGLRISLPFTIASHTVGRNMSFVTRGGMYHVPHHEDNPPLFIGHAGTSIIEGIYERDDNSFLDYNPQAGEAIWLCFSYFTDS